MVLQWGPISGDKLAVAPQTLNSALHLGQLPKALAGLLHDIPPRAGGMEEGQPQWVPPPNGADSALIPENPCWGHPTAPC